MSDRDHYTSSTSLPERIKNLGKKARERLQEEMRKRPEIVRLSDGEEFLPINPQISASKPKDTEKSAEDISGKATSSKKQDTTLHQNRKRKRSSARLVDPIGEDPSLIIDKWMPNISHLQRDFAEDELSSVLALHGIPMTTTAQHVKRFFDGLQLHQILVLVPYHENIPELDPSLPTKKSALGKSIVKRYEPSSVRVWVKFDKRVTAEIALQRSGEILEGAALALAMVPRRIATFGLSNLAIDVVDGGSNFLDVVQKATSKQIHSTSVPITDILWSAAALSDSFICSIKPRIRLYLKDVKSAAYEPHQVQLRNHVKYLQSLLGELPDLTSPFHWNYIDPSIMLEARATVLLREAIRYAEDLLERSLFLSTL